MARPIRLPLVVVDCPVGMRPDSARGWPTSWPVTLGERGEASSRWRIGSSRLSVCFSVELDKELSVLDKSLAVARHGFQALSARDQEKDMELAHLRASLEQQVPQMVAMGNSLAEVQRRLEERTAMVQKLEASL